MRLLILCLLLSLAFAERAQPRIVGGDRAPEGLSRYMAIVRLLYTSGIASSCTATILSSRHLLTAAHCFLPISKPGPARFDVSYAQIGEIRPRDSASNTDYPVIRITAAYLHKDYVPGDGDYRKDIAVIELEKDIPEDYLFPVKLVRAPRAKKSAIAVGYGVTGEKKGIPQFIQSVKLKVWDFQDCREMEDKEDRKNMSGWRQACVVSQGFPRKGGQDTCWGDRFVNTTYFIFQLFLLHVSLTMTFSF